jgi:hypothetical protein
VPPAPAGEAGGSGLAGPTLASSGPTGPTSPVTLAPATAGASIGAASSGGFVAVTGSGSSVAPGGPDPTDLSRAFKLHSRPGAPRVILLDFTGHTTSGTAWNDWVTGGATIVTPPFDMDGDTSSFSAAELQTIITTWRYVAEDYAPFDVSTLGADVGGHEGLWAVGHAVWAGRGAK